MCKSFGSVTDSWPLSAANKDGKNGLSILDAGKFSITLCINSYLII